MIRKDIIKKLELLKEKSIHISCVGRRFYNGKILEINSKKDFVIIIDLKIGEIPILFEEINFVEPLERREDSGRKV